MTDHDDILIGKALVAATMVLAAVLLLWMAAAPLTCALHHDRVYIVKSGECLPLYRNAFVPAVPRTVTP